MSEENTNITPIQLDIQDLLEILPHRYPFLLIDRVTEIIPNKSVKAYKNLTYNETFFQGHFPGNPIMPGVLMLEAIAQAGIILIRYSLGKEKTDDTLYVFTGLEKVRFRRQVVPGDKFEIVCENPRNKLALWKMDAKAYVDGQLIVEATVTAAATPKEKE